MTKKTSKSKKVDEIDEDEEIIEVPKKVKKVDAHKVVEASNDEHDSLSVEGSTSSSGEDAESSIDENALMQFFQQAGGMFGGNGGGGAPPGAPHMQEFLTHGGESVTKVMVDIRGIMGALVFEFQKFNQNIDKFLQTKNVEV